MRKTFFTILFIAFASVLFGQTPVAPSGSGTSSDPYLIANLDNLAWMQGNSYTGKYFKQTADIDASSTSTWDSDSGFAPVRFTNSEYDGNNKSISGLTINRPDNTTCGMFSSITSTSTVKNLSLENVDISGFEYVGAITGNCDESTVTDCSCSGSVSGEGRYVGGMIGTITGTSSIESSSSSCTVLSKEYYVGGFVGNVSGTTTISKCNATGNVTAEGGSSSYVGQYIGSFVGQTKGGTISITECYATGNSKGSKYVGGFVGLNRKATISNSYSLGNATRSAGSTRKEIGAFAGRNYSDGIIEKCYSIGSVYNVDGTALTESGFIADDDGTSTDCFWDSDTSNQTDDDSRSGSTAETTANMQKESTFTDAGWDFTNIWTIVGTNYPNLQNNSNANLPVELISFTAIIKNGVVLLTWATATEVNNYGFEIEKNIGNNKWETIGFVNGAGNSNSPNQYSYVDTELNGTASYRLKQIDTDGKFEYSDIVTITTGLAKTELFQNYPNPFNPTTQINFNLSSPTNVKISVFNVIGEKVAELVNKKMSAGMHKINFTASDLPTGVYIYKIETANYNKSMKMLLLK